MDDHAMTDQPVTHTLAEAESEARHEVECPSCGATIRARMADAPASSLRAELAEAQAEIARLTGFLERARSGWYECLSILSRATDQLAERSAIVEAATALVKYRRDPGPNPTRLELERRIAAVDDAVAAVAEGQKL